MTTKIEVILQGPDNWTEWNDEFQSQAIAMNLWDYIKENPKPLLTEPAKPVASKYKTASSSTPTTTTSTTSTTTEPIVQPTQVADLNAEETRKFQVAWNIYASDLKQYKAQANNIRDLKKWVRGSIAK